eukprot:760877-Hanusia_phi.AAC.1
MQSRGGTDSFALADPTSMRLRAGEAEEVGELADPAAVQRAEHPVLAASLPAAHRACCSSGGAAAMHERLTGKLHSSPPGEKASRSSAGPLAPPLRSRLLLPLFLPLRRFSHLAPAPLLHELLPRQSQALDRSL